MCDEMRGPTGAQIGGGRSKTCWPFSADTQETQLTNGGTNTDDVQLCEIGGRPGAICRDDVENPTADVRRRVGQRPYSARILASAVFRQVVTYRGSFVRVYAQIHDVAQTNEAT